MFSKLTDAVNDLKETKIKLENLQKLNYEEILKEKEQEIHINKQELEMLQQ